MKMIRQILLLGVCAIIFATTNGIAEVCKTTGGFSEEGTPCQFPFTYVDPVSNQVQTTSSCISTSVMSPFSAAKNGNRNPPRHPVQSQYGSSWCSVTKHYDPSKNVFKKKWGYCSCTLSPEEENAECKSRQKNVPCAFAPNCKARWSFQQARDMCKSHGARLCSVAELTQFGMGASVCAKGKANERIWTLDDCIELPPNRQGKYTVMRTGKPKPKCTAASSKSSKSAGVRCCIYPKRPNGAESRNVLMIVADDMRPDLMAAYGRKLSVTPALDKFAKDPRTLTFGRAYANYAQCVPSRLSFVTGLSPEVTGNIDAGEWLRTRSISHQTLPEFFASQGFYTLSGGKVFHERGIETTSGDQNIWNETYQQFTNQYTFGKGCQHKKAKPILMSNKAAAAKGVICTTNAGPDTLVDFVLENKATAALTKMAWNPQQRFFLAVGFYKPHLPLNPHNLYWKMLPSETPAESTNGPEPRSSYFEMFYNADAALSVKEGTHTPWDISGKPDFVRIVRRAYAAAIAQTDSRIGILLDRLDQLELTNSTLVVVFGDHGFLLGEDGLWNKDTLFELALRIPFMVRVPWIIPDPKRPVNTVKRAENGTFELLNLYRTLAGLMKLPITKISKTVQGRDLSGYIVNQLQGTTDNTVPAEAYALVRRCAYVDAKGNLANTECAGDKAATTADIYWMGYSIRTKEWRYVVWVSAPHGVPNWSSIMGQELYDHRNDANDLFRYDQGVSYDIEKENVAASFPAVVNELRTKLQARFKT